MAVDLMHELEDVEFGQSDEMTTMLSTDSIETGWYEMKASLQNHVIEIKHNAKLVDQYTDKYKISSTKSEHIQITTKIETISQNNSNITSTTRSMIATQKDIICKTETSAKSLRVTEFNHLVQNFRDATHIFHAALNTFDAEVRDKQMRQIHFLNDSAHENDIERLQDCDYRQRQQYIEKTMQLTDDRTLDRLIDLEEQRNGMLNIEQSIKELKALYENLNVLIVDQGMLIDKIQNDIQYAHDKVQQGVIHLNKAEEKQKRNRKIRCWCFVFLLMIVVIFFMAFLLRNQD